jgi:hypothetical protein
MHGLESAEAILIVVAPYGLWFLFCLFAINWKKMWPTLAEGAWVPLLLLLVLVALEWSRIRETEMTILGVIVVGNFWWQLLAVGLIAALGLFAGWVQNRYGWMPFDYPVAPVAHGHDHVHAHANGGHDEHTAAQVHGDHAAVGHDEHSHGGQAHH